MYSEDCIFKVETAQLKFVCCLAGQIEDVIDLRKGKRHMAMYLE